MQAVAVSRHPVALRPSPQGLHPASDHDNPGGQDRLPTAATPAVAANVVAATQRAPRNRRVPQAGRGPAGHHAVFRVLRKRACSCGLLSIYPRGPRECGHFVSFERQVYARTDEAEQRDGCGGHVDSGARASHILLRARARMPPGCLTMRLPYLATIYIDL